MENTVIKAEQVVTNKINQCALSAEQFSEVLDATNKMIDTAKSVVERLKKGIDLLAEKLRKKYTAQLDELRKKYQNKVIPSGVGGPQLELIIHEANVDAAKMKKLEKKIANANKEAAAIVFGSTGALISAIAAIAIKLALRK